jgi:DNA (cytosine-5)-methyltransferase 1
MTTSALITNAPSAAIVGKPAYRVPTMSEIRGVAPNGYTVASLFSGAGGACLGFEMAGFRVVYANEFVAAARETYQINHPGVPLDPGDVRGVTATTIRDRAELAQVDVLEGSPPCASFSTAGRGSKGWNRVRAYSDKTQRVDDLFFEYTRILAELQPRCFVAENVAGLVGGNNKGYFLDIMARLRDSGYRVRCERLDAQWLGVPQHRERIIFIGARDDLKREPVFPTPLRYRYTVAEVLPHIKRIKLAGVCQDNWQSAERPFPTIAASSAFISPTARFSAAFVELATGEQRRLEIDEVKLLSSFPADFVLTGTFEQQWERAARAVPPIMMHAIASVMRQGILDGD